MYHRVFYIGIGTILGMVTAVGAFVFGQSSARLSIKWSDWVQKRKYK